MNHRRRARTLLICNAAVIAAIYTVLTALSAALGLSGGIIQFRISEALCIFAVFTPAAIPGMTLGCIISNLLTGAAAWDVIFGSAATLVGIIGSRMLKKHPYIAPAPYFAANTLIVPFILRFVYGSEGSLPFFMLTVGAGEAVCAWIGGILLYLTLRHSRITTYIAGNKGA